MGGVDHAEMSQMPRAEPEPGAGADHAGGRNFARLPLSKIMAAVRAGACAGDCKPDFVQLKRERVHSTGEAHGKDFVNL